MSKMAAENRFVAEFERNYVARSEIKLGDVLTVTGVGLGVRDDGNGVAIVYTLQDAKGCTHEVEEGNTTLFEGDSCVGEDDVMQQLYDTIGLEGDEVAKRVSRVLRGG